MQENQTNQQNFNFNETTQKKEFTLKKILADRFSNKLITRAAVIVIVLLIALRITLYFTLPHYYIHLQGERECPSTIQQKPGYICEVLYLKNHAFWTSNITGTSSKDLFVVVQGIGRRFPNKVDYTDFDMEYEYNTLEIQSDENNDKNGHKEHDAEFDAKIFKKRKIEIYCPKNDQICNFNDYIFETDLNRKNIQLEIHLLIPEDKKDMFQSFEFTIWKGNKKIGKILTAFQYTFFAISFIMYIIYVIHYMNIQKDQRSFEHFSILILSFSLVLFNNPFYILSLYHQNKFFQVLGTIFVCAFIILAFHFWIVVGRRVDAKEYKPYTVHADMKLKLALFLTFLLLILPSSVYNTSDELHPAFYGNGKISLLLLIALILAVLTTGGFWIYIMILFCQNLSGKKFVPQRYKSLIFVSILFFVYLMFNFLTGFYHYSPTMPGRNIVYLITVNLYVYFLQVMWRTQEGFMKFTVDDEQPEQKEEPLHPIKVKDFEQKNNDKFEDRDVEQDHFNLDKLGLEENVNDADETFELDQDKKKPVNMRNEDFENSDQNYNKRKSHEFQY